MTIKEPLLGQLNQGSIFSCAKAERYPTRNVSGIVLTARCDLEQDKYNVLNYAPVVSLNDWLTVDGYELILARVEADINARTEGALKTVELPPTILYSQTPSSILQQYIRAPNAETKLKKAEARFVELEERLLRLQRWQGGCSDSNLDIFDHCEPIVQNAIRELILQKLSGYYFLPKLEIQSEESGFVALLREVNHLPRELAKRIAEGMVSTEVGLQSHWHTYVDFSTSDFAMPIGEMTSPDVEHLLQTFSHLFGRIGLPDPDKTRIEALCRIKPQAAGRTA